jgi:hypothetical protein
MNKGKSDDDKSSDSVIVFDGKEPNRAAKWFECFGEISWCIWWWDPTSLLYARRSAGQ